MYNIDLFRSFDLLLGCRCLVYISVGLRIDATWRPRTTSLSAGGDDVSDHGAVVLRPWRIDDAP